MQALYLAGTLGALLGAKNCLQHVIFVKCSLFFVVEIFENVQFDTANISSAREATCEYITANYANYVREWLELGVTCVGGCCKVGPENIRQVCEIITEARKKNPLSDLNFSKM